MLKPLHLFSPLSLIILASTSDGFVMQMSQRNRLPESIISPAISEIGVVMALRRLQASQFITPPVPIVPQLSCS
ncbi:MAG TPA: hypothetical protein VMW10_06890, partial [Alphaproteobacteria bacterium]|nr:hypothetical protein [Alphaproteobacteria bacterium]